MSQIDVNVEPVQLLRQMTDDIGRHRTTKGMQMICMNTGKMAEDDVTDVVLAAVAFIKIFGSDTDTDDDNMKEWRAARRRRRRPRRY